MVEWLLCSLGKRSSCGFDFIVTLPTYLPSNLQRTGNMGRLFVFLRNNELLFRWICNISLLLYCFVLLCFVLDHSLPAFELWEKGIALHNFTPIVSKMHILPFLSCQLLVVMAKFLMKKEGAIHNTTPHHNVSFSAKNDSSPPFIHLIFSIPSYAISTIHVQRQERQFAPNHCE